MRLADLLARHHAKIDKIIIWGNDLRIENILDEWFVAQPVFENNRVRVFQHKL
jgi:hypothetical protein